VQLFRDGHGRGPTRAKTYLNDDLVVSVLRDSGLTPLEQTLVASGGEERVLELREDLQRALEPSARRIVEQCTGRSVLGVLSAVRIDPDVTVETFVMDGAVER
jgi:uncharacterized protein YbcI